MQKAYNYFVPFDASVEMSRGNSILWRSIIQKIASLWVNKITQGLIGLYNCSFYCFPRTAGVECTSYKMLWNNDWKSVCVHRLCTRSCNCKNKINNYFYFPTILVETIRQHKSLSNFIFTLLLMHLTSKNDMIPFKQHQCHFLC